MNHDFDDPGAGDAIGGWLLGHELARGRTDFPGDPLPGGHLGRPADLAFWGSVLDDERVKVPVQRFARMEEIGDVIAFLHSDASSYVVGSALVADGGFTVQ